jgi:hypothetical protein
MASTACDAARAEMSAETIIAFGDLLKDYCLAAGLTQEALAEQAGASTVGQRKWRKNIRMSPVNSSGSSMAAKCPPRSNSDHCTMWLPRSP